MFVCCECCVLSGKRSLRRIDHSSRGVLPTVARHCVWSRNLDNEEAEARYRAVKIQPQWVVTPGKQTNMISAVLHWVAGTLFVLVLQGIDNKLLYWESTLERLVKLENNNNNWNIDFAWDGRFLDERKTFEIKYNRPSDTLKNWYQFEELCRLELINHTVLLHGFILLQTSWYCYCCCVLFLWKMY